MLPPFDSTDFTNRLTHAIATFETLHEDVTNFFDLPIPATEDDVKDSLIYSVCATDDLDAMRLEAQEWSRMSKIKKIRIILFNK